MEVEEVLTSRSSWKLKIEDARFQEEAGEVVEGSLQLVKLVVVAVVWIQLAALWRKRPSILQENREHWISDNTRST